MPRANPEDGLVVAWGMLEMTSVPRPNPEDGLMVAWGTSVAVDSEAEAVQGAQIAWVQLVEASTLKHELPWEAAQHIHVARVLWEGLEASYSLAPSPTPPPLALALPTLTSPH